MFGFEPTQPIELEILTPQDAQHDVIKAIELINKIRKEVPNILHKAQNKEKIRYDRNHKHVEFYPGQLVLVEFPNIHDRNNSKFNSKFKGPWKILRKISDVNYVIRLERNGKMTDDVVHIARIKPFHSR